MDRQTYPRLVGDIGGTNARFAWLEAPGSPLQRQAAYRSADFATLADAIRHYLSERALPRPAWCAVGIANPVVGDQVQMTNHHWSFSISQVRNELGLERFLVINDFTALALALPVLSAEELQQIGPGRAQPGAAIGVIGPGTGLGMSGLVPLPGGGGLIPIEGEGGHATLAAATDREEAVLAQMRQRHGHVSAERALSGPGLVNLYVAVCELAGAAPEALDPAGVVAKAQQGSDPHCAEALELFCAFLGTAAGNLALTLGARGGIYIGGGIVPRLGDSFARSAFRERFESKGRFRDYLHDIPTWVVLAASPALLGAARAMDVYRAELAA